jgi:predicted small lipoprotein YifL
MPPPWPRFGLGFRVLATPHLGRFPLIYRSNRLVPMTLLAGTLVLAGCGVRGPLEPPVGSENIASPNPLQTSVTSDSPGASVTSTQTQTATSKSFTSPVGRQQEATKDKDGKEKKKRFRQGNVPLSSEPVKPDRPFILDKLL